MSSIERRTGARAPLAVACLVAALAAGSCAHERCDGLFCEGDEIHVCGVATFQELDPDAARELGFEFRVDEDSMLAPPAVDMLVSVPDRISEASLGVYDDQCQLQVLSSLAVGNVPVMVDQDLITFDDVYGVQLALPPQFVSRALLVFTEYRLDRPYRHYYANGLSDFIGRAVSATEVDVPSPWRCQFDSLVDQERVP